MKRHPGKMFNIYTGVWFLNICPHAGGGGPVTPHGRHSSTLTIRGPISMGVS